MNNQFGLLPGQFLPVMVASITIDFDPNRRNQCSYTWQQTIIKKEEEQK